MLFYNLLSLSPLCSESKFFQKNTLLYLAYISQCRTFAPAFQETESIYILTCCNGVGPALTDNKNNFLFIWIIIIKVVIFAVRFAE
ncbi:hypothetical protein FDF36_13075 [Bacteroides fragilis]|nr:hypothetical protein [Bacteroides fragilis]